jgi:tRNA (cmo5U34)-methyltransferase
MDGGIYRHFSENVNDYDTVADAVVMRNNELHEQLVGSLPFGKNDKIRVLDLGCGTGHGMRLVLERFPNAAVTGIDFQKKMIAKSRQNLSGYADRVELVEDDFNYVDFGGKYDAVISAVAIHNSTHEQKKELFEKVFNSLGGNGPFANADFAEGENSVINGHYRSIYRRYMEERLSGPELRAWLIHAFEQDMPMKLSEQFSELRKAGFGETRLLWQFCNEALYLTKK